MSHHFRVARRMLAKQELAHICRAFADSALMQHEVLQARHVLAASNHVQKECHRHRFHNFLH
jgi:hypothetical protein